MLNAADLPDDIAALKAMLIAANVREVGKDERIERLDTLVAAFKQAAFGRKSEKIDPDQFDLTLEDLEAASRPSMPKRKLMLLQANGAPNCERPIAARFPSIFPALKRSLSRET